jgi:hypothetical protein
MHNFMPKWPGKCIQYVFRDVFTGIGKPLAVSRNKIAGTIISEVV